MGDKIFDLLTQEEDVRLEDYSYPVEDFAFCESVCMRINYIRHLYKDHISSHANANFGNDDVLRSYYMRLRMIAPLFIMNEEG